MVIVFDFDGTLHDTTILYGCACRNVLNWIKGKGFELPSDTSDKKISTYLGWPAPEMWDDYMPYLPEEIKKEAIERVNTEMGNEIKKGNITFYPGTFEMLDELKKKGYRLMVLSNCTKDYLEIMDSVCNLRKWFDGLYAGERFDFKPKTEIMKIIMEDFPDTEYVMAGDRSSDIEVGDLKNVKTIGCTYGFGSKEELNFADFIAEKPLDILEIIESL